jgi:hypothetical protein
MSDPLYAGRNNPVEPVDQDTSISNRAGAVLPDRGVYAANAPLVEDEEADLATGTVPVNARPVAAYPANAGYAGNVADAGNRYYAPVAGREHLSGLFNDSGDAQAAVNQLESLGVPRTDISIIYKEDQRGGIVRENAGTHASEGAGAGSMIGGVIGAILGALAAAATSIIIPGVGIVLAGPIAGALAGAGAGGVAGGLLGALIGAGIPEETARVYEAGINNGGVVVVADVPGIVAPQARAILNNGPY